MGRFEAGIVVNIIDTDRSGGYQAAIEPDTASYAIARDSGERGCG